MRALLWVLTLVQALASARVFLRMARTATGHRIRRSDSSAGSRETVTVLVPVLNEVDRLGPCLDGLSNQGDDVESILVIDGGSTDGTQDLVMHWGERDARIQLIDASPVPDGVNGKAHNLQTGYKRIRDDTSWVLTMDADVRAEPALVTSLLAHAREQVVEAFSVATRQQLSGPAEGLVHPSMLATLVYRFGIPGHPTADPAMIQANGQCFFVRKPLLDRAGGFSRVLQDVSEDVTLARIIAIQGTPVGFYESDDLVHVEMYAGWQDAWTNWTRSLPMRDRFTVSSSARGLAEATLTAALPLWLAPVLAKTAGKKHPATMLNVGLIVARCGVLAGMARAYRTVPWTYWVSPLADMPVLARIWMMWGRRVHTWRGRTLVTGETE